MSLNSRPTRPAWFQDFLVYWKTLAIIFIPAVLLPMLFVGDASDDRYKVAYVAVIMASFWVLELLPLAATALLPVAMFPIMGVMSTSDVTENYMTETGMNFFASMK